MRPSSQPAQHIWKAPQQMGSLLQNRQAPSEGQWSGCSPARVHTRSHKNTHTHKSLTFHVCLGG